jgi:hypothetical protein
MEQDRTDPMPRLPYLPDRSMVSDAALLIEQFGAEAGLEASERAARSRTLGNHLHFARWRQVERLIDVLSSDGAVGTIH